MIVFWVVLCLTIPDDPPAGGMAFHGLDATAMRPRLGDPMQESITAIEGGRVVTPTGTIEGGTILIQGDRIESVRPEGAPLADQVVDATDRIVVPGIIDIHGDDIEHQLRPRPEAAIDRQTAAFATDRLNIAHGITTKAHAIAFDEADGSHRSPGFASKLVQTLAEMENLFGTNLVHARFEASHFDPAMASEIIGRDNVVLASLMHHTPGEGQYESSHDFLRRYGGDGDLQDDIEKIVESRSLDSGTWEDVARELKRTCQRQDIPLASHDDVSPRAVEHAAGCGFEICEFPLTKDAAIRANELGQSVVMGAPNLVRGESLFDNLSTRSAIEHGVLDVLCADYHPPSLLQSMFIETGDPIHERVARVTERPARLLGLGDRGRIAAGARADLVVIDPEPMPRPAQVIVGGTVAVHDGR